MRDGLSNTKQVFKPHEDITAYELARCLIVFLALDTYGADEAMGEFDKLPDACKRHWYTEPKVPPSHRRVSDG